jgi:hypothetical protein
MGATYDAGQARALYLLDTTQFDRAIQRSIQQYRDLQAAQQRAIGRASLGASSGGKDSGGDDAARQTADAIRLQRAQASLEAQQARLARARGEDAGAAALEAQAIGRLLALLTRENVTAEQSIAIQRQLASAQQQVARAGQGGATAAQELGQALRSNLLSIIGPAAVASAVIGGVQRTVESFKSAFVFKAELDQTNQSIAILLRGVRDSGRTFAEAQRFADKYKLTQAETSEAISESIPVIRQSTSSIEDVLSVFTRLTILKPGKTFADASRAISELQAGQTVSLEKIFNVPIAKANAMKHEIEGGADAIQVLNKFLTDSGVGMDALEVRTRGAIGALNDLKRAEESLKLAQADFAQGPGLFFLQAQTNVVRSATQVLSGDFGAAVQSAGNSIKTSLGSSLLLGGTQLRAWTGDLLGAGTGVQSLGFSLIAQSQAAAIAASQDNHAAAETRALTQSVNLHSYAIARLSSQQAQLNLEHQEGGAAVQEDTNATLIAARGKEELAAKTQLAEAKARAAADAFLQLHPNISASGVAALAAAGKIDPLLAQLLEATLRARDAKNALADFNTQAGIKVQAAEDFRVGERSGGQFRTSVEQAKALDAARAQAQIEAELQAARDRQVLATGTAAQKQATLNRQLQEAIKSHGQNSKEAIDAQTALLEFQQTLDKRRTSELGKQLTLEEKIRDSKEAQLKAALDAQELAIKDRQDRRREDREIRQAERILASAKARQEFKDAASDKIALIQIERQKRALELQEKGATVQGTVINGRVFQSRPGAPLPPNAPIPPLPFVPPPPAQQAAPPQAGSGGLTVQFLVDGHLVAQEIIPDVMASLRGGLAQSQSAGGGRQP